MGRTFHKDKRRVQGEIDWGRISILVMYDLPKLTNKNRIE